MFIASVGVIVKRERFWVLGIRTKILSTSSRWEKESIPPEFFYHRILNATLCKKYKTLGLFSFL